MRKRVLVVCGTAIATSTHVAVRIKELARKAGVDADIIQARVQEVRAYESSVDLIVSTTQLPTPPPVPVISGIPFLTGIGESEVENEILNVLKQPS